MLAPHIQGLRPYLFIAQLVSALVALLSVAVAVVSVFQLATWDDDDKERAGRGRNDDDDDDNDDDNGDPSFSNTAFVVFVSMVIVFTVLLGARAVAREAYYRVHLFELFAWTATLSSGLAFVGSLVEDDVAYLFIPFFVLFGGLGADLSYIRYVLTNQGFSFLPARYGVRSRFANPALNLDDSDEELSSETATDLRTGLEDSDEYSE